MLPKAYFLMIYHIELSDHEIKKDITKNEFGFSNALKLEQLISLQNTNRFRSATEMQKCKLPLKWKSPNQKFNIPLAVAEFLKVKGSPKKYEKPLSVRTETVHGHPVSRIYRSKSTDKIKARIHFEKNRNCEIIITGSKSKTAKTAYKQPTEHLSKCVSPVIKTFTKWNYHKDPLSYRGNLKQRSKSTVPKEPRYIEYFEKKKYFYRFY